MEPQKTEVIYNTNNSSQMRTKLLLTIGALILLVAFGVFYYFKDTLFKKNPNTVIAQVGQESIYQKDLDTERASYPAIPGIDQNKMLLEKMARDSAILQGAQDEGLITLDSSTFNSLTKDYPKRVRLVAQVEKQIQGKAAHVDGGIVSIFFINNLDNKPGPLGYEGSKQLAKQKITALYTQVKNGSLSIQQAGEAIKNDKTLEQLDYSYQINAYFPFSANQGTQVTLSKELNQALFELETNQVSEVFAGQVKDASGKDVEGVFMFGVVTSKTANPKIASLDEWVKQIAKKYSLKS